MRSSEPTTEAKPRSIGEAQVAKQSSANTWIPPRALATACAFLIALAGSSRALAQQPADGFAVERFYPSAPGGGWLVMDALDMRGGLGGAMAMTVSHARSPLRVGGGDGSRRLAVVSAQSFADFGFAATYDRFRVYLGFDVPLFATGASGAIGDRAFTAPSVDPGANPDNLSGAHLGFDARLFGAATSAFRLGLGVQLFVPNDARVNYDNDGTYRAMGRVLFAGDVGRFAYAGHLGVHLRPLDDAATPGSPRGSELLFGVAAGSKLPLCAGCGAALVVGPELFGATAFRTFFGEAGTALEGLLTGRVEGTAEDGAQLRVKLGIGAGIHPHFGAPEGRLVFGVEIFDRGGK